MINPHDRVKFQFGTSQQYSQLEAYHPNVFYFCEDTGDLYLGDTKITSDPGLTVEQVNALIDAKLATLVNGNSIQF